MFHVHVQCIILSCTYCMVILYHLERLDGDDGDRYE
jgi:hypothetical protein